MLTKLFKGPFEAAGCKYDQGGWVTTDLNRGEQIKWSPDKRECSRWDVIENQWVPSKETRAEFLELARQYQAKIRQRK